MLLCYCGYCYTTVEVWMIIIVLVVVVAVVVVVVVMVFSVWYRLNNGGKGRLVVSLLTCLNLCCWILLRLQYSNFIDAKGWYRWRGKHLFTCTIHVVLLYKAMHLIYILGIKLLNLCRPCLWCTHVLLCICTNVRWGKIPDTNNSAQGSVIHGHMLFECSLDNVMS